MTPVPSAGERIRSPFNAFSMRAGSGRMRCPTAAQTRRGSGRGIRRDHTACRRRARRLDQASRRGCNRRPPPASWASGSQGEATIHVGQAGQLAALFAVGIEVFDGEEGRLGRDVRCGDDAPPLMDH